MIYIVHRRAVVSSRTVRLPGPGTWWIDKQQGRRELFVRCHRGGCGKVMVLDDEYFVDLSGCLYPCVKCRWCAYEGYRVFRRWRPVQVFTQPHLWSVRRVISSTARLRGETFYDPSTQRHIGYEEFVRI